MILQLRGLTLPNRLLRTLPASDLARLLPHFSDVPLHVGAVLSDEDAGIEYVYFPVSGMVSLVIHTQDGRCAETGVVGCDGAIGLLIGLGIDHAAGRAIVQVPGRAMRISRAHFLSVASQSKAVREMIERCTATLLWEAQQNVACNALHGLQPRLCRWLLHSYNLCHGEPIPLTQRFLAQMLAVRRTTVTFAASMLQSSGIIRYRRGLIHIIDQDALQERACECYGLMRERMGKVLPIT